MAYFPCENAYAASPDGAPALLDSLAIGLLICLLLVFFIGW
jgi:hypothetical protein